MSNTTLFKKIYRVFVWSTFVVLVWTLILILKKSSPPDVPVDPTAAARVEQKFAAAELAKSAGRSAQVQLDRTELNSYLAQNLQLEGSAAPTTPSPSQPASPAAGLGADPATVEQVRSSVKDVKIDLDDDLVKAYVVFDFHGKDLSLELAGRLGAQDGYLKFDPVSGKLGSMPLPQSVLQSAVDKMMTSPENRDKLRLPPDISNIQITNGQVVISYK